MAVLNEAGEIRAAGGVVLRQRPGAPTPEVLLVHRPRYRDWTLPKGKAEPGETDEQCAVREVEEETGLRCELVRDLGEVRYRDRYGRPKVVRYWEMRPMGGSFRASDEVDDIRWVELDRAGRDVSYSRDAAVIDRLS